jgi:hypothetical protein
MTLLQEQLGSLLGRNGAGKQDVSGKKHFSLPTKGPRSGPCCRGWRWLGGFRPG